VTRGGKHLASIPSERKGGILGERVSIMSKRGLGDFFGNLQNPLDLPVAVCHTVNRSRDLQDRVSRAWLSPPRLWPGPSERTLT